MTRRGLILGAMVALAALGVGAWASSRRHRTRLPELARLMAPAGPRAARPTSSMASCQAACVGLEWLFAQAPCLRAEVCGGSPLACAVRTRGAEARCLCPGFEVVDYNAPQAAGRSSLAADFALGRASFGQADRREQGRLNVLLAEGRVAGVELDISGLPNPEALSPVEAVFDVLQSEAGAACPVPSAEALGVPVQVRGEFIAGAGGGLGSVVHAQAHGSVKSGPLAEDAVERYARVSLEPLHSCFSMSFTPRGTHVDGQVAILATIEPDGRVSEARVDADTSQVEDLGSCVAARVSGWQTPFRPTERAEVLLRYTLAP